MVLVKDGQLGWVATALCAAALYDYTDMIDLYASLGNGAHMPIGWHFVLAPLVVSIIGAVLVAALGAIYSTPELKKPAPDLRSWLWHYKSFVISALWTLTSAVTFALIHLYMLPTATQWRF